MFVACRYDEQTVLHPCEPPVKNILMKEQRFRTRAWIISSLFASVKQALTTHATILGIIALCVTLARTASADFTNGPSNFASLTAVPSRVHRPEAEAVDLARQVEIRRTAYGVLHIRAENLRAAAFALGYAQVEDYGERVIRGLVEARGELARIEGRQHLDSDVRNRERYTRAVETYHQVPNDVRDVLEGFAEGVNHFIRKNSSLSPKWAEPVFTGHDVAARDIGWYNSRTATRFVSSLQGIETEAPRAPNDDPEGDAEDGSNTWAVSGGRTKSGKPILMRNPHLSWTAGYYEAHVVVPGKLDFYGDFRIGGPFGTIGGFNRRLGWSTTNNSVRTHEIYAFEVDPKHPEHFRLDGVLVPISRRRVTVEYRDGDKFGVETREVLHTPFGPVIHRDKERIYVIRDSDHGQFRLGEQFLRMMQAENLDEWLAAMRLRAKPVSNFTYADSKNIFFVWNGSLPDLPHPPGNDRTAIFATRTSDVWTTLVPFEKLPQLLNPKGGYVRNENDSPHYTNMREEMSAEKMPATVERQRLRLRSQHALELLDNDDKFTLEDTVRLKHSMRMLLADRVKEELIAAVRATSPSEEIAAAVKLIESWNNTVAIESRGAVLFAEWWDLYKSELHSSEPFRHPWIPQDPMKTPRGISTLEAAAKAFVRAVAQTRERFGSWSVSWGEVHRVRHGKIDVPVGGGSGDLGCYRVLGFRTDKDGKRSVSRGDAWVLAVEFTDPPRAYSVLAYGQSNREDSPHFSDQASLFAANEMKEVAFTEEQIRSRTIRRYRPGSEDLSLQTGGGK